MLRASRAYVTSHGGTLRRQVMITGFSQGASAGLGLGRALQAPYARTIEGLFDGRHTADRVVNGLPSTISGLLTPFGMNLLRHPVGGLAAATFGCQAWFAASGARVPTVNLGTPDYRGSRHLGSNVAGTGQIVRWFLRLTR